MGRKLINGKWVEVDDDEILDEGESNINNNINNNLDEYDNLENFADNDDEEIDALNDVQNHIKDLDSKEEDEFEFEEEKGFNKDGLKVNDKGYVFDNKGHQLTSEEIKEELENRGRSVLDDINSEMSNRVDERKGVSAVENGLGEYSDLVSEENIANILDFAITPFIKGAGLDINKGIYVQDLSPSKMAAGIDKIYGERAKNFNILSREEAAAMNKRVEDTVEEVEAKLNNEKVAPVKPVDLKSLDYDEQMRIRNSYDRIPDLDEEVNAYKNIQSGALAFLLGEGNPINANKSFLDQKALMDGVYKYDLAAIKKFKDAQLTNDETIKNKIAAKIKFDDLTKAIERSSDEMLARNKFEAGRALDGSHIMVDKMIDYADTLRKARDIYNRTSFWKKLFAPFSSRNASNVIDNQVEKLREYIGNNDAVDKFLNATPETLESAKKYLERCSTAVFTIDKVKRSLERTFDEVKQNKIDEIDKNIALVKDKNKALEEKRTTAMESLSQNADAFEKFKNNPEKVNSLIQTIKDNGQLLINKNTKGDYSLDDLKKHAGDVLLLKSLIAKGINVKECQDTLVEIGVAEVMMKKSIDQKTIDAEMNNARNIEYMPISTEREWPLHAYFVKNQELTDLDKEIVKNNNDIAALEFHKQQINEKELDTDEFLNDKEKLAEAFKQDYERRMENPNVNVSDADYFMNQDKLDIIKDAIELNDFEKQEYMRLRKGEPEKQVVPEKQVEQVKSNDKLPERYPAGNEFEKSTDVAGIHDNNVKKSEMVEPKNEVILDKQKEQVAMNNDK